MSVNLNNASDVIGMHLEKIRREVFRPEFRGRMKLTFIARDPANPESDMFVSEDDINGVSELLQRTAKRATP